MTIDSYRQILELSQDGFLILQDYTIVDCNNSLVKMLGYDSKDELLNLSPSEISPTYQEDGTLSSTKAKEKISIAIKNKGHRFEWIHTKKNTDEVYCEVTLTPIRYKEKDAVFATLRDISNTKTLQLANQKLTTRLGLAFSGNGDGIWDWNLEDDIIYFSPSWKKMLGYSNNEIKNNFEEWRNRVHPDDLEKAVNDIQSYLDGKIQTYENYHRLKHKDGSWVWILDRGKAKFDTNGKALRFIGTHTNITREKNLEEELMQLNNSLEEIVDLKTSELLQSTHYLETIFNTVQDSIAILDLKSNFLLVNDAYEKLTGFTKEELYKTSCVELTKEDMIEKSSQMLAKALKTGSYTNYEKICIGKDATEVPISMDIILMPDKTQFLAVVKDLTKHKKYKKDKELHEQQMLQQSRLAQMGEMISMIAHQWRQPLGAISTTAANLALKLEIETYDLNTQSSKDECNTYFLKRLNNIEGFVESLTQTIDDFRNFYKPNKHSIKTRLDNVLDKSLNIIKSSLENDRIEIIYNSTVSKEIKMYDNEIMQVILNILKNAQDSFIDKSIKYKQISIDVSNYSISISDNGGGIPKNIVNKIYDPYFSSKSEKNGTGLGLYMSKIIIEEHHNGKLYFNNTQDGVCFTINLSKRNLINE